MTLRNKTDTLAAILREHEAILREHEAILQEVSIAYDHITDHKAQVEAPHRKRTDDVTEPVTDPDRPTTMARIFLELRTWLDATERLDAAYRRKAGMEPVLPEWLAVEADDPGGEPDRHE